VGISGRGHRGGVGRRRGPSLGKSGRGGIGEGKSRCRHQLDIGYGIRCFISRGPSHRCLVHKGNPATGAWNWVIIVLDFSRNGGTGVPRKIRKYNLVGVVNGRFVGKTVRGAVIAKCVWFERIPIAVANKLKTIASGIVCYEIISDGRGAGRNRSSGIANRDGVINGQILAAGDRGGSLRLGNGEVRRPNGRGRSGNGHTLAPKKRACGITGTVIPRAIVGDEGKDLASDRVVNGVRPSGSRYPTGAVRCTEGARTVVKSGAVPGVSRAIVAWCRAGIASGGVINLDIARGAGDFGVFAALASNVQVPGTEVVFRRRVLGFNGQTDLGARQECG
jgi:hypothetical protein